MIVLKSFEKRMLAFLCLSFRLSVLMQQLVSQLTNFLYILYLSVFRNSFEKIQVFLKPDNNKSLYMQTDILYCTVHLLSHLP
jgi:hypothetical protein